MAEGMSRPKGGGKWLTGTGRAFVAGAAVMLLLVQTGAAFNWPVFEWLQQHRPRVSVEATEPQP